MDPKIITPRHPWLVENREYFQLAELSYRGGARYISAYLYKHPRESESTHEYRRKGAYYINYIKKIVKILTSFVLKNIVRNYDEKDEGKSRWLEYLNAIDLFNSMDTFIEKKMKEHMLLGNALTIGDAIKGKRAYVLDLNYLDIGDIRELPDNAGYGIDVQRGEKVYRYDGKKIRISEIDNYNEQKEEWRELDGYEADIENPILSVERKLINTEPYFEDAVYINRGVFNLHSNISKQLFDTGNLLLVLFGVVDKSEITDKTQVLRASAATPVPAQFVQPPLGHLEIFMKYIDNLVEGILSTLNIYREDTSSQASGIAKSYDYSIMSAYLSRLAVEFERFERSIWEMLCKFDSGLKYDKITVEYKRDFDLRTLAEEIQNTLKLMSLDMPESFKAELKKKLASQHIDNEATLEQVNNDIDAGGPPVEFEDDHKHEKETGEKK